MLIPARFALSWNERRAEDGRPGSVKGSQDGRNQVIGAHNPERNRQDRSAADQENYVNCIHVV